ncbi:hypothetical protein ACOSQ2_015950 [Xanthoceras sorbifolium]
MHGWSTPCSKNGKCKQLKQELCYATNPHCGQPIHYKKIGHPIFSVTIHYGQKKNPRSNSFHIFFLSHSISPSLKLLPIGSHSLQACDPSWILQDSFFWRSGVRVLRLHW